jgi:hypothetical protein
MRDFGVSFERVSLMCDNISAISVADIFTKPLDASRFADLRGAGGLLFAILMAWFAGELVLYLVYLYFLLFSCIFFVPT